MNADGAQCPICGGRAVVRRWVVDPTAIEGGVDARSFRPSSERFGETSGVVMTCGICGHGFLERPPPSDRVAAAYADAADVVSLREHAGQMATADRGLARLEQVVRPGPLIDIGCWTGAFVEAAKDRGWDARGIEPSGWAVERAVERGLDVVPGDFGNLSVEPASMRSVVVCDVLEHLEDPDAAVKKLAEMLEAGGALYLTVPDAGSLLARRMGSRWWSVLPMHLQYFTRASMLLLLARHGLRPALVTTHAKTFSARYYAERLAGYSGPVGRLGTAALERVGLAGHPVTPNFRDRMEVIAVRH